MSLLFFSHPTCEKHDMGVGHPECPERLRAIARHLDATGLGQKLTHEEAPLASRESLTRVHDERYVSLVFERAPAEGLVSLDPDTAMNPYSLEAALRAAGANTTAVDRVLEGKVKRAFCSVRPPGHHAESSRAMGFCLFNNIAVAAAHAVEVHGLERVAIVDFDVHHGNGTEEIFLDSPHVMLCSSFQHPFYPGTGASTQAENIINIPLPAGANGESYRRAVETPWRNALEAFSPQLVLVSAGFDGHVEDPLAGLELREEDYQWLTEFIVETAEHHSEGRIVSTLEGGYSLPALARSVATHLSALLE